MGIRALTLPAVALVEETPAPTATVVRTATPQVTPEITEAPDLLPEEYGSGEYLAGINLAVGEYLLFVEYGRGAATFIVIEMERNQETVLATGSFTGQTILTAEAGQSIRLIDCEARLYNPAQGYWPEGAERLPAGMYRIGDLIQPGTYTLVSTGEHGGYWEVDKDSLHRGESVLRSNHFSGQTQIELQEGEYIKLLDAEMLLTEAETLPDTAPFEEVSE